MAFSFTVSPASLTAGGVLTLRFSGRSGKNVSVYVGWYNGSVCWSGTYYGPVEEGQEDNVFTVRTSNDWFQNSTYASGTFLVSCRRVDQQEDVRTTVTITVSESQRFPVIDSVSVEPVQPQGLPAAWASDYIASVTQAKISVAAHARFPDSGESIASVKLSYPGGADVTAVYDSTAEAYVATMPPVTGDTAYTVTVTDNRNKRSSDSVSVSGVVPYTLPTVSLKELFRCDQSGTEQEGGAYYKIKVKANIYTALTGNSVKKLTAGLYGETAANLTDDTAAILGGALNQNSAYTVVVTVQDQVSGEIQRTFKLAGKLRDFVLRRGAGVTHLGVGCTPANVSGHTTIQLPEGGQILLDGADIAGIAAALKALAVAANNGKSIGVDNGVLTALVPTASLPEWTGGSY